MINITDRANCCGCTACASACPHDAITMKQDCMGFSYPVVSLDLCTNCGICDKVCAFHPQYDTSENLPNPIPYGARHKDIDEISTSRSGAVFVALADWMLAQGGIIYGAGYKGHFQVAHKRATTREEYLEFKGSKYVQSDMGDIFRNVREDLLSGKKVLFTGTPCQTAGLHSYIGKKLRNNLYLADIICHGVPGPNIWRDYITLLEKRHGSPIVAVNFRDKSRL
ncbi:MAG: Coenzyme F420 hydrogenase/dehydrogenase, beta subunit C-terminal domain, partial [Bacteroidaceae bacterium]|nr:Coenzyme F420 hydrogenase/dehydrogenase, beta subunit C-terminal domain [Bacteroidaceae bacterium]